MSFLPAPIMCLPPAPRRPRVLHPTLGILDQLTSISRPRRLPISYLDEFSWRQVSLPLTPTMPRPLNRRLCHWCHHVSQHKKIIYGHRNTWIYLYSSPRRWMIPILSRSVSRAGEQTLVRPRVPGPKLSRLSLSGRMPLPSMLPYTAIVFPRKPRSCGNICPPFEVCRPNAPSASGSTTSGNFRSSDRWPVARGVRSTVNFTLCARFPNL